MSPRRDSNPQSLPPEGSALSIRPQGPSPKAKNEVLPGLEPGLQGSEPWVLTNYTIEPQTYVTGEFLTQVFNVNRKWCTEQCAHLRSGGVVGYHVCLTRTRSRVRSSSRVAFFFWLTRAVGQEACKRIFEPRIELGTFSVLD